MLNNVYDDTSSGFLVRLDEQVLLAAAVQAEAVTRVDREPGSSLVAGTPVAVVVRSCGRRFRGRYMATET